MMASFPYATCNGKNLASMIFFYLFTDKGNSEKRNLSSPIRSGPFVTHVHSLSLSYTVQETAKDINLQQHHATNMSSYIILQLKGSYVAKLQ